MEVIGMQTPNKFALTAIAIVVSTFSATAQTNNEPGLFAEAKTTIAHDDNIYRVTDELAQSDFYLRIAPELRAVGGIGKHRFSLSYTGDYAKFSDADDADFNDHDIRGRIDFDHSLRLSSTFEAGYQKDHEEPGSINRIQLEMEEYNKFEQNFLLAGFAYGSEEAVGRFVVNYRRTDKNYTTNNLDFLDFVADQLTGRFLYRVAPATRMYFETVLADYDYYPGPSFELDNTYLNYRVGLSWDFTGQLTGDINLGYQERDYDLDIIRDIDGITYDGKLSWSINSYTKLVALAKRESVDSSLEEASGFLRTTYSMGLSHKLTELLKLKANAGYANDELVFSAAREDKRYAYQFGLEYSLTRNVLLTTEYIYEERDSTLSLADFDANIFSLSVIVSFGD